MKLGLGIVGCGDIAGYTALLARLSGGLRLAACCDRSPERAQAFARRHRVGRVCAEYGDLLADPDVQAVYLAVPHHLHFEMAAQAITAGKHILLEKPITRTLAEGVEIVRRAEQAGVKLAVNYQYRYDAGCYGLARAVQDGQIGTVRYGRINLPWRRGRAYFENSPWHSRLAQAGGGTLLTQGSHLLDVALWACGSRPVWAAGQTARQAFPDVEVEDLALGLLELEGGALLEVCSSMASATEQALSIEIYGSRATALYTDRPWPRVRFVGAQVRAPAVPVFGLHALQRSLEGFRRWVQGGDPHLAAGGEALPVLAAVEAVYRSARSGRRETVAEIPGDSTLEGDAWKQNLTG